MGYNNLLGFNLGVLHEYEGYKVQWIGVPLENNGTEN